MEAVETQNVGFKKAHKKSSFENRNTAKNLGHIRISFLRDFEIVWSELRDYTFFLFFFFVSCRLFLQRSGA